MVESLSEYLGDDVQCEGVLQCLHGLSRLEQTIYVEITRADEPLTVDEIAAAVDRERSTVYRAVRRLRGAGLVEQEQINYDQGGYYHVYYPRDPAKVTDELQRVLNDWYAQMGQLIQEFERRYSELIDGTDEAA